MKHKSPRDTGAAALQHFINRRPRESASLMVLMSAGLIMGGAPVALAQTQTTPRVPTNALPVQARDWQQRGTGATYSVVGTAAKVNLTGPANILHWTSMDVGSDASLTFKMDASTSRVLNKVDGGAWLNKTVIDGALKSNGQVYIYNPNGIIFGKTATVNVNSLVASTLKLDDQRFMDGLLSPSAAANFAMDTALGFIPGAVVVEGQRNGDQLQQAALTAQDNGFIMLLAPQVSNAGQLNAPDGQVILAAGSKVYLAAPENSTMRGLRVEVSSDGLAQLAAATQASRDDKSDVARSASPAATNEVEGSIQVQRGNITMVGLAVNQKGLASATTSVNLNGSIILKAQDGAVKSSATASAVATHGGALVLGAGSSTTVLPTLDDTATSTATVGGQEFKSSFVALSGKTIVLSGEEKATDGSVTRAGAQVVATSGNVTLTARANPNESGTGLNKEVKIELGQGSVIDVSGSTGTTLAMESNVIAAELRGGELADNPLLKNSAVRGKTVYFDRRKAAAKDIAVANVTGYLGQVKHTVGEYTAAGGTVTMTSEGSITQKTGSRIDVSGGWVDYASGYINTSKLTLGNRLYDIETASASLAYDGVAERASNSTSNWEAGYREGSSAGTVQFNAPTIVMKGQLQGQVTVGARQRDQGASTRPLGGQLLIGNISDTTLDTATGRANFGVLEQFGYTGNLTLGAAPATDTDGTLNLDTQALAQAGFNRISAITTGNIDVRDTVNLAAGGQMRLGAGGALNWQGDLNLAGGSVTAAALGGLQVQGGVQFNLAGQWQNDSAAANPERDSAGRPSANYTTKGGTLRLYANQLSVGDGVSMNVSGGALLDANNTLTGGDAGAITLQATTVSNSLDGSLQLGKNLALSGYAVVNPLIKTQAKGGAVTLVGRNVVIGGGSPMQAAAQAAGDLYLGTEFFSQGGFTSQTVRANGNLSVTAGTTVMPRADAWVLHPDYATQAAGAMDSAATAQSLPLAAGLLGARQAASLTLSATGRSIPGDGLGQVSFGTKAAILADSGASVTLSADQQVTVDGTVQAQGGTVSLLLLANAPDANNTDYNNRRSVWLGQNAKLLANGTADRVFMNAAGVASGEVLDGGTVRIGHTTTSGFEAAVGYVVAEQGSLIDVSGAKADNLRFKYGSYLTDARTIGSAGGTIDIRAREGLMLAGQLRGAAGTSDARGGTLNVVLDRENSAGSSAYPQAVRNLTVTAAATSAVVPTGRKAGDAFTASDEGQGVVSTATFADGGFANLKFKSQDQLTLAGAQANGGGNLALNASSSIDLNAPNLKLQADTVDVTAPYVSLGSSDVRYQTPDAAVDGNATLNVAAKVIDLKGHSATQGAGHVNLSATEDIRLVGAPLPDSFGAPGAFNTGHQLTLKSAQAYPTTLSNFTLALTGADSTLRFESNGKTANPVLSAAGSVTAQADHIVQAGRLVAPFGSITLQANQDLTYERASVTSVAGDTTVPFGTVVNGSDWTYELNGQTVKWTVNPGTDASVYEAALPTKQIISIAPSVVQKTGALLDASGGGALMAYEFTPGPGGSSDVLLSSGGKNFAINVNYRSSVAPQDWQSGSEGLKVGDQVYLSGGNGLPAGYYTLLPAHYALLSGGYAIEAASGTRDMVAQANRVNADGSMTLAGYRTSSTDGRGDTRWSGFTVSPQALINQRSEIKLYDATTFFTAQAQAQGVSTPRLPVDAGRVAFDVINRLTLDGVTRLQGAPATGTQAAGARGTADISASNIAVVTDSSVDTGTAVKLLADDLVALGADSLLLGGTRSTGSDGTHLTVSADTVRIDNNAAHPLTGSELILAATDTVQVTGRAVLKANSATDRASTALIVDGTGAQADGALLRLSGSAAVDVSRATPAGQHGRLEVGAGATLVADKSMYLDATRSMMFNGRLNLNKGAALGVSAPRISLGSAIPAEVDGMVLDSTTLASLNGLAALSLSSYSTMDWYGTVNLGSATMQQLNLSTSGLQSYGATATVSARNVRLDGGNNFTLARPATATGSTDVLTLNTQALSMGSGTVQVQGFKTVQINASKEVRAAGTDGALTVGGDLTVTTPLITTNSGAGASFNATGALNMVAVASTEASTVGLGGNLSFHGGTVMSNAQIAALAGQITVQGDRGVNLSGGTLDVHGEAVSFGSGAAYAPAGRITLNGGTGDVTLGSSATLNLSAQGAAAGTLAVSATGSNTSRATLNGSILGAATAVAGVNDGAQPTQGSFALDVAQAPTEAEFGALNAKLNSAGLTEARDIRVRHGDVSLGAGAVMRAHDISIAVDDGNLTVAGTLDASGSKGGTVALYAAQADASGNKGQLTLQSSARINAQATQAATSAAGSAGDGGQVVLGVSQADGSAARSVQGGPSIVAEAGSAINVVGAGAGQGGTVLLRAPRVGSGAGSDVAVGQFKTTVTGSRATTIEGVKVYSASTISEQADSATNLNAGLGGKMAVDASDFMRSQSGTQTRLGRSDVQLSAGVEVRSSGDLTVSVNEQALDANQRGWNLNTWRFGGQAGTLSLRAAGNLTVKGSISDGFVASSSAMPNWKLDSSGTSWSYRLVGGADMSAANPLSTRNGAGDVGVQFARAAASGDIPVALVRTGTGRIDVAAGRDVKLGSTNLVTDNGDGTFDTQVFGAAIYTAGRAATLVDGFKAPTNTDNALYGSGSSAASFGTEGGAISLTAGRDVVGAPVAQLVNNWLFRQGRSGVDANGNTVFEQVREQDNTTTTLGTAWWSRTDYFSQGVATFGGGDIKVTAGGSVRDLSANVATNAYMPGSSPTGATLHEQGGGDLTVRAGADIAGGSFYVQKGQATLHADGSIGAGSQKVLDVVASTPDQDVYTALRPILALGDTVFDVSAGRQLEIETAYNPTLTRQSTNNVASDLNPYSAYLDFNNRDAIALSYKRNYEQYSNFSTYSDRSAVNLISVGGDVVMHNSTLLTAAAGGTAQPLSDYGSAFASYFSYAPATYNVAALAGSVTSEQGFAMAPSATGELNLLAEKSVQLKGNGILKSIVMLDNDPATLSTPSAPSVRQDTDLKLLDGSLVGLSAHTSGMLHADDAVPVRVVAKTGSITGQADQATSLILPKKAEILAGQDIRDLGFAIQHNSATDITTVQAGRDFIDSTNVTISSPVKHVVTGSGLLALQAGRDIDLGNSFGVVTRGNLDNAYLSAGGASVVAVAGAQQTAAHNALSPAAQLQANQQLFTDLVAAGKKADLTDFDKLIADAFPVINGGDINVFGSQVKTEQGGSIDLLAPGGSVVAGLVSVPVYLQSKPASENGIFTVRGGAIRSLVKQDFLVNQGRVFSLGGGDISLISQYGNIDAGRGTKTASSAPPPLLTTDASGNTKIDISASISGSGIATLSTSDKQAPSNVYAVAPRGIFDAGDAGVRSTGTVEIQASVVLNAGNIAASSGVSGAVAVDAGAAAASAAPSNTNSTQDATKQLAAAPQDLLGLTVELLGFGDAQDPKSDADESEEERKKRANAKSR